MPRTARETTARRSWRPVASAAVLGALLVLTACGASEPQDPEKTSTEMVFPDRAAGYEDLERMCNEAEDPPRATLDDTERWAEQEVRIACVDETDLGVFVAQDFTDVPVTEELIRSLTPGEPIPEGSSEAPSSRVRFVVDDTVYTSRMVITVEF